MSPLGLGYRTSIQPTKTDMLMENGYGQGLPYDRIPSLGYTYGTGRYLLDIDVI